MIAVSCTNEAASTAGLAAQMIAKMISTTNHSAHSALPGIGMRAPVGQFGIGPPPQPPGGPGGPGGPDCGGGICCVGSFGFGVAGGSLGTSSLLPPGLGCGRTLA